MPRDQIVMKVEGPDSFVKLADQLGQKEMLRVVQAAMRKGGRVLVKAAKDNLKTGGHEKESLLRKSIAMKQKSYRQQVVSLVIGPARGYGETILYQDPRPGRQPRLVYEDPVFIAHLIEFGTVHAPAYPFMRPALDERGPDAVEKTRSEVEKGAAKAIAARPIA